MMKLMKEVFVADEFDRFLEGDAMAFRKAFDFYFPIILRYAMSKCGDREDAEDIAQEAFTLLFLHREKIFSTVDIYPYLFVITKRLCLVYFRKKIIGTEALPMDAGEELSVSFDMETQLNYAELSNVLNKIILSLPAQQQEVYRLSRLEDLPHQEIAEHMGISKNTVKNHLLVATKTVRLKLQKIYFLLF